MILLSSHSMCIKDIIKPIFASLFKAFLMDLISSRKLYIHTSQALSAVKSPPQSSILGSHLHSSHTSFPIIAVAIIGILATACLLVSYYIFVIKCCLNWHRIDLLRRFSFSQRQPRDDPLMVYPPATENRGLDEAVIHSIPISKFKKDLGDKNVCECAICLNEFQDQEKLRMIPNCGHVFHIDCIDVWLQSNANCPLCRTSISRNSNHPFDQVVAPSTSPQDLIPYTDNITGRDEDYVVIELSDNNPNRLPLLRVQERLNSGEISRQPISHSPGKMAQQKAKKFKHFPVRGDECLDIRIKDDNFSVQPLRRSFSMDSATDRQLYLAVQEIIRQNSQINEVSSGEGCSNKVQKSFFSLSYGRGSRSSVLPVHLEP